MNLPELLGLTYFASELLLTLTRRSRGTGSRQDRSTLLQLWLVILSSIAAALFVTWHLPAAGLPHADIVSGIGVVIFAAGLALRWWAITVLGRFFTVDVQIAPDHRLVQIGPFRVLRHPSYTGVLVAFVGFGFCLANWVAFLILMLPITMAFVHRMTVEEDALCRALGQPYVDYMARTKRLIPWFY